MKPFFVLPLLLLGACQSTGEPAPVEAYPLDVCIVADTELGSMGEPVSRLHGGQEFKFCCAPCVQKFEADPDAYAAKLAEAEGR